MAKNKLSWISSVCFHSSKWMKLSQETTPPAVKTGFSSQFPQKPYLGQEEVLSPVRLVKATSRGHTCRLVFATITQHLLATLFRFVQQVQFFHFGLSWFKHSGGYRAPPLYSLLLADPLRFCSLVVAQLNSETHSDQHQQPSEAFQIHHKTKGDGNDKKPHLILGRSLTLF